MEPGTLDDTQLLSGYAPVYPAPAAPGGIPSAATTVAIDAPPPSPLLNGSAGAAVSGDARFSSVGSAATGAMPLQSQRPSQPYSTGPPAESTRDKLRRWRAQCCAKDCCSCCRSLDDCWKGETSQGFLRTLSLFGSLLIPVYGILLYVTLSAADQQRSEFRISLWLSIAGLSLAGLAAFIALRIENFKICAAAFQYKELQAKYYFGALLAFGVTVPSLFLQSFGLTTISDVEVERVTGEYHVSSRVTTWVLFVVKLAFFVYDRVSALPQDFPTLYSTGDDPVYLIGWPHKCAKLLEYWCVWLAHLTWLGCLALIIVQLPYMAITIRTAPDAVFVALPDTFTIPYFVNNTQGIIPTYSVTPYSPPGAPNNASNGVMPTPGPGPSPLGDRDTSLHTIDLCDVMFRTDVATWDVPAAVGYGARHWPCQDIPLAPLLAMHYLPSTSTSDPTVRYVPTNTNSQPFVPPSAVPSLLCTASLLNVTLRVRSNRPLYLCMSNGNQFPNPLGTSYSPYTYAVFDPRNASSAFPLGTAFSSGSSATPDPTPVQLSVSPTCAEYNTGQPYGANGNRPALLFYGGATSLVNLSGSSLDGSGVFGSFCTGVALLCLSLVAMHVWLPRLFTEDGTTRIGRNRRAYHNARTNAGLEARARGCPPCGLCCATVFIVIVGGLFGSAVYGWAGYQPLPVAQVPQYSSGPAAEAYYTSSTLAGFNKLFSCYNDRVQYAVSWGYIGCLLWPLAAVAVNVALVIVYRLLALIVAFFFYCCCKLSRDDFDLLRPVDTPKSSSSKSGGARRK